MLMASRVFYEQWLMGNTSVNHPPYDCDMAMRDILNCVWDARRQHTGRFTLFPKHVAKCAVWTTMHPFSIATIKHFSSI